MLFAHVADAARRHSRAVQARNERRGGLLRPLDVGGLSQRDNPYPQLRVARGPWIPLSLALTLTVPLLAQEPKKTTPAPAQSSVDAKPVEPAWRSLFDGKTLTGWKITEFAGRGDVKVDAGRLLLETGVMTGVTWSNDLPRMDYEISLEAMRVDGSDFFCALTFPVDKEPCSFIVGGWGGGVVGLSSIDGEDAAHNETATYMNFENGKWFKVRVKVTQSRIEAWIDSERVVNLETKGRAISIRPEVELSKPLGVASWSTTAALRNIQIRRLP